MPDGFCPPFQCQSGIIAKSTMHHAKATPTQTFSDLCAGFHQMPGGDSSPVCVSVCIGGPHGSGLMRKTVDFPQPPAGVEEEHDHEASAEEEEHVVEQALAERYYVLTACMYRLGSSFRSCTVELPNDGEWLRAYRHERPADMTAVIWGVAGFVEKCSRASRAREELRSS